MKEKKKKRKKEKKKKKKMPAVLFLATNARDERRVEKTTSLIVREDTVYRYRFTFTRERFSSLVLLLCYSFLFTSHRKEKRKPDDKRGTCNN